MNAYFLFFILLSFSSYCFCSNRDMSIELSGYILPKCSIEINDLEIDFSFKSTVVSTLNLYCNTRMTLNFRSENGGLINTNSPEIKESFVPYRLSFSINSILGSHLKASSKSLIDGKQITSKNQIPFASQAKLLLSLMSPIKYAGNYTDKIWISVNPDASQGGL